jgi:hypothetical protein
LPENEDCDFPKQNKKALIMQSVYLHFLLKNNTRI